MTIQNIQVDGETQYTLTASDILLLKDEMPSASVDSDVKRRVAWIITHKLDERWLEFKAQWLPILMTDPTVTSIPSNRDDFIAFVLARSDYKDRDARDLLSAPM